MGKKEIAIGIGISWWNGDRIASVISSIYLSSTLFESDQLETAVEKCTIKRRNN